MIEQGGKLRRLLVALLLIGVGNVAAQETSTVFNDDGTVTFYYRNDGAKEVMVNVQFAGRCPMSRDAQSGLWTATVGPAATDIYLYCFIVDGVSVMDPLADGYFPNEGFKNSLLDIPPKEGRLTHHRKNVPHGSLDYIHYYSESIHATNNAIVYLPPSYYHEFSRSYPVFYLISGTTDTEEVYYKVGRMNDILDNLIAEGAAKEMIVVLPYGNPMKLTPPADPNGGYAQPALQFGNDPFSKDLINNLMPYVEANYRTFNDRDHRGIGGFSRGGNQGLSNGLHNLDKFSYLCSYSSFTSMDIPGVYDNAADTNSKLHLFWLGVGTDDFLYGSARDYMEFLDKKGIRSVKEFTTDKFGHTWMNARYFLDKTFRLLFNREASEAAMANGVAAPEATGKEPAFTPGVVARMFPRPVISPEYGHDAVTFRLKSEGAKEVKLKTELSKEPLAMQRGDDGIWSIRLTDCALETFEYYFLVDGTAVADPNNMYLSPCKGFKPSYTNSPYAPYSLTSMGNIKHGHVSYNPDRQIAWYLPADITFSSRPPIIHLVPGKEMTMESWFKAGGADAIADKLRADGKCGQVLMTTDGDFVKQMTENHAVKILILRADDYATWPERRAALIKSLSE